MDSLSKEQYLKAAAQLENLKADRRNLKANESEIEKLELVVKQFRQNMGRDGAAAIPPPKDRPQKPTYSFDEKPPMVILPLEVSELVEKLRAAQEGIDFEKNRLADSLYEIPDNVNCKAIVKQIKGLREQWVNKGDEIRFVLQHGKLPSAKTDIDASEFLKNLPVDLLEIDRKIRYRKADLSKYRDRLKKAKTDVQRQLQETNISIAETEISLMKTQFNSLK